MLVIVFSGGKSPYTKTYDFILEKLKTFGLEKYFGKNA